MRDNASEYDEIRRAYDDAFHRWSRADPSPGAERLYHERRDQLARYILQHPPAVERATVALAQAEQR